MTTPRAKCIRCGNLYYGWALIHQADCRCVCGGPLALLAHERETGRPEPQPAQLALPHEI